MKECKKCGAIIPDESKEMVCKECKQKTKKTIKTLAPIVVGATAITYVLFRGKTGGITAKQLSNVTKDVVLGSTKNVDPVFGGLSQSTLDSVAKGISRGVKAVVADDTLKFFYKSASGKTIHTAFGKFDNVGKFIGVLGSRSNSPIFFFEKVLEKRQEIK
jgi:Na+/alanine symporter